MKYLPHGCRFYVFVILLNLTSCNLKVLMIIIYQTDNKSIFVNRMSETFFMAPLAFCYYFFG